MNMKEQKLSEIESRLGKYAAEIASYHTPAAFFKGMGTASDVRITDIGMDNLLFVLFTGMDSNEATDTIERWRVAYIDRWVMMHPDINEEHDVMAHGGDPSEYTALKDQGKAFLSLCRTIAQRMSRHQAEPKAQETAHEDKEPQQEKTLRNLLPPHLRTDEALKIFQRAIDANMIGQTATGLKWLQIGTTGGKAQLAYFCGKLCGYEYGKLVNGYRGNVGDRVCYEVFEKLFNVNRLDRALAQCHAANKPQWWRKEIDALFY